MPLNKVVPNTFAVVGGLALLSPLFSNSLYTNIIAGTGLLLLFIAWLTANLFKLPESFTERKEKVKVLVSMGLCVSLGFSMLIYYELQMPKYSVAKVQKELYRVPPQLSQRQLFKLGRECNTYGNTLCSHDVFAKIVRLDPRNYKALANLAMAQSLLGFHDYAVKNFKRAIDNGVDTYDIFKFYGHSLRNLKKLEEASNAYKRSLRLNPNQENLKKRVREMRQPEATSVKS